MLKSLVNNAVTFVQRQPAYYVRYKCVGLEMILCSILQVNSWHYISHDVALSSRGTEAPLCISEKTWIFSSFSGKLGGLHEWSARILEQDYSDGPDSHNSQCTPTYLQRQQVGFRHIMTSQISQDLAENLFGIARQSSGCNTHPMTRQFIITVNCLSFNTLASVNGKLQARNSEHTFTSWFWPAGSTQRQATADW